MSTDRQDNSAVTKPSALLYYFHTISSYHILVISPFLPQICSILQSDEITPLYSNLITSLKFFNSGFETYGYDLLVFFSSLSISDDELCSLNSKTSTHPTSTSPACAVSRCPLSSCLGCCETAFSHLRPTLQAFAVALHHGITLGFHLLSIFTVSHDLICYCQHS